MNSEDAKAYFEMRLKDKYKYANGYTTQREAFEMAIKALEKQIPKKPIAFWDGNENLIECPACKCPIDICEAEWSRQFCGKCGQAILWPEGNHSETSQDFNLDNIAKGLKKLRDPK